MYFFFFFPLFFFIVIIVVIIVFVVIFLFLCWFDFIKLCQQWVSAWPNFSQTPWALLPGSFMVFPVQKKKSSFSKGSCLLIFIAMTKYLMVIQGRKSLIPSFKGAHSIRARKAWWSAVSWGRHGAFLARGSQAFAAVTKTSKINS